MATRGRKPKPTALKVLEGNPGKRPLNDREPVPPLSLIHISDIASDLADIDQEIKDLKNQKLKGSCHCSVGVLFL